MHQHLEGSAATLHPIPHCPCPHVLGFLPFPSERENKGQKIWLSSSSQTQEPLERTYFKSREQPPAGKAAQQWQAQCRALRSGTRATCPQPLDPSRGQTPAAPSSRAHGEGDSCPGGHQLQPCTDASPLGQVTLSSCSGFASPLFPFCSLDSSPLGGAECSNSG